MAGLRVAKADVRCCLPAIHGLPDKTVFCLEVVFLFKKNRPFFVAAGISYRHALFYADVTIVMVTGAFMVGPCVQQNENNIGRLHLKKRLSIIRLVSLGTDAATIPTEFADAWDRTNVESSLIFRKESRQYSEKNPR